MKLRTSNAVWAAGRKAVREGMPITDVWDRAAKRARAYVRRFHRDKTPRERAVLTLDYVDRFKDAAVSEAEDLAERTGDHVLLAQAQLMAFHHSLVAFPADFRFGGWQR